MFKKLPWRALALCVVALVVLFSMDRPRMLDAGDETRFVAVMEDSTDCVMLEEPERWAEPSVQLKFNQQVTWISDVEGTIYSKISVKTPNGTKIGYIKKNCLSKESQYQGDSAEAEVAVGAEAANYASKGLNKKNENSLSANDPNFEKRIAEVEATETAVQNAIFGGPPRDNITKGMKAYRNFGKDGGLFRKGGK